jgi:hypothetical protein
MDLSRSSVGRKPASVVGENFRRIAKRSITDDFGQEIDERQACKNELTSAVV